MSINTHCITRLCFTSFLLFFYVSSFSQQKELDSLQKELKITQSDTQRINLLNEIGWYLMYDTPDSAIFIGKKALHLAEKINWEKGLGKSNHYLGTFYFFKGDNVSAEKFFNTAFEIHKKRNDQISMGGTLQNLGNVYKANGELDRAEKAYRDALKINIEINRKDRMASNYGSLGLVKKERGDLQEALNLLNKSLRLYHEAEDKFGVSRQLNNIGIIHRAKGNYSKALEYYFMSLKLAEDMGVKTSVSSAYNNIGIIYKEQGNYEKAIDYISQSLEIDITAGLDAEVATKKGNLGLIYSEMGRYDEALRYYKDALKDETQLNNPDGIARNYGNIANAYIKQAQRASSQFQKDSLFREALYNYDQAYNLSLQLGNKIYIASDLAGLGNLYNQLGQTVKAEEYLKKSLAISKKEGFLAEMKSAYGFLADVYEQTQNYKEAYRNYKEYIVLRDSIYKEQKSEEITRLEFQYAFDKKESLLKIEQEKKDAIAREKLAEKEREKQNLFFSIAFVLLLLGGAVLYGISKQKNNRRLKAEKEKTEAALRDRETLLREIHHRVKNNLQIVSSLLSIQGREITDEKAQKAVQESRNRVHSMALIHQFLYGDEHLNNIDMQKYIYELGESLFSAYRIEHNQIELQTDIDSIFLDVDIAIPLGLILNELITNALKYAFPDGRKGQLHISLKETNQSLILKVKDNGVGLSENKTESGSFGMKLINAFKQKLGAEYNFLNHQGVEAIFVIHNYNSSQS